MIVGPFTPGFVADQDLVQVAEIGIILLMFGVGLHFSFDDLSAVKRIAIPGAIVQMICATLLGYGLGTYWGFSVVESFLFGFSLSVASTVVLLRALEERHAISTKPGHIAVGWLVVEDIFIIISLVLIPMLATSTQVISQIDVFIALSFTLLKVVTFVSLMLIGGKRVIPRLLQHVNDSKSQELFSLGVIAVALGVAFAAYKIFDSSFALGAFFAGLVISNTNLSHKVLTHLLPLRDIFSVLFFVSVGMLFDPFIVIRDPLGVASVVAIIIFGKSIAAILIMLFSRYPLKTSLVVAASLAQVGEFSFVLSEVGVKLKLLKESTQDLIMSSALISITLNPLIFKFVDQFNKK